MTDPTYDAGFAIVRQALIDADTENADIHMVVPYQDFVGQGKMEDTVHLNQVALNEVGTLAGTNVAALLP